KGILEELFGKGMSGEGKSKGSEFDVKWRDAKGRAVEVEGWRGMSMEEYFHARLPEIQRSIKELSNGRIDMVDDLPRGYYKVLYGILYSMDVLDDLPRGAWHSPKQLEGGHR
ncbi:unnamed protein product, partial [Discosporangium mesarthrocarpum]